MKRSLKIALAAVGLLALPLMFSSPTNRAQTLPDHHDAALRTRNYRAEISVVRDFLKVNVADLRTYGRNWRVISADENSLRCEVPVLFFTDDLHISLQVLAARETSVNIVSASRVGKGDFGENRRHILQVLKLLDEQFAR